MTIHLDTSAVIAALTPPAPSLERLAELIGEGHRVCFSSVVLYEWLRGPRTSGELRFQEDLIPRSSVVPYDVEAAAEAARLYSRVRRPQARDADLAIAACAIVRGAALWTLNEADFDDIPGLLLV